MDYKNYEIHKESILGPLLRLMQLLQYLETETQQFDEFSRKKDGIEKVEKAKLNFQNCFKEDELQNYLKAKMHDAIAEINNQILIDKLMVEVIESLEHYMGYSELFNQGFFNGHSFQKDNEHWESFERENQPRHILFYNLMAKLWKEASQYMTAQKLEPIAKYGLDQRGYPIRIKDEADTYPMETQTILVEDFFKVGKYDEAIVKLLDANIIEQYSERYRIMSKHGLTEKIISIAIISVLEHLQYFSVKPTNIGRIIKACFGLDVGEDQISKNRRRFLNSMESIKGTTEYEYLHPIINALA